MDNQLFVAGICTARDPDAPYQAWGHSSVASPWGDIIATTDHNEDIVYAKIGTFYFSSISSAFFRIGVINLF